MKSDKASVVIRSLSELSIVAVQRGPGGPVEVEKKSVEQVIGDDFTELLTFVKVNHGNGFHFVKSMDHSHLAIESVY